MLDPLRIQHERTWFAAATGCPQGASLDMGTTRAVVAYAEWNGEGHDEGLIGGVAGPGGVTEVPAAVFARMGSTLRLSCPTMEFFAADPDADGQNELIIAVEQGGPPDARGFGVFVYGLEGGTLKERPSAPAATSMAGVFTALGLEVPGEYAE